MSAERNCPKCGEEIEAGFMHVWYFGECYPMEEPEHFPNVEIMNGYTLCSTIVIIDGEMKMWGGIPSAFNRERHG